MPDRPTYSRLKSTGPRTRAFIGIELPQELKTHIQKIQNSLPTNVVPENPDTLHIELVYLGHIAQERLSAAHRAVREQVRKAQPFEAKVGSLDYYYSGERRDHSIIYLSIKDPDKNLQSLFKTITNALRSEEFSPPHRLDPHIAIGSLPKQRDRNLQTKMLEDIIKKEVRESTLTVNYLTFFQELRGGGIKPILHVSLRCPSVSESEGDAAIS